MSLMYALYQPGDSWLHRLDPRAKLLFAFCGCFLLLLNKNLWLILSALALTQLALLSAGIDWKRLAWVWRITAPTMMMIAVLWVVFYPTPGEAFLSWRFLRIGIHNLAEGVAVALRIGALAFVLFFWLFSTDQTILVRSLVTLGLPYTWGLTLAMALRYIPTMTSTFRMISDAQQARGLDLSARNPIKRARAYMPITVAMLITAFRTAENLSRALQSRALGASPKRTFLRQLHLRPCDIVFMAGIVLVAVVLLWLRFTMGLGAYPLRLVG
ncbi:MAG: energy-coupling factor transporter transmembrane component T [Chloroflexota bacterium]|nr:energy-coupling factor transporter transmembrane component T [Chloroflexota bacterium]